MRNTQLTSSVMVTCGSETGACHSVAVRKRCIGVAARPPQVKKERKGTPVGVVEEGWAVPVQSPSRPRSRRKERERRQAWLRKAGLCPYSHRPAPGQEGKKGNAGRRG